MSNHRNLIGVFRPSATGGVVIPTDRHNRTHYHIPAAECAGLAEGALLLMAPLPQRPRGISYARIVERLGDLTAPENSDRIAVQRQSIPTDFSPEALAEAARPIPITAENRIDFRAVPLVTIDGADARDFDDAVWAEADSDGWHVLVAIADVAWHVRPDSALDTAAQRRGNSVYLTGGVIPMLPPALSDDLCSLGPGLERACLAIELWLDRQGEKIRHRIHRGLMRSAARLTYEQVEAALRGAPCAPGLSGVLAALDGASRSLLHARDRRGALAFDPPGLTGARLDSQRMIEELMILANVAAAETLAAARQPALYRVHDAPEPGHLARFDPYCQRLGRPGLRPKPGQKPSAAALRDLMTAAIGQPEAWLIQNEILRAQAQAVYTPENRGHFGLALPRYTHFTSPIRRYADLIVHRALITALNLGAGGLPEMAPRALARLGRTLSEAERRAAEAEQEARQRRMTLALSQRLGENFSGRISGITRLGLFVSLDRDETQVLIPPDTRPAKPDQRLDPGIGGQHRLGDAVTIRLTAADPIQGRLRGILIETGGPFAADLPEKTPAAALSSKPDLL